MIEFYNLTKARSAHTVNILDNFEILRGVQVYRNVVQHNRKIKRRRINLI